ncbi:MAG: hypothetical protein ACRYFX_18975 [Janthinobacterium lividum]
MNPTTAIQQQVDIYTQFIQALANAALTGEQAQQVYLALNGVRDIFHQQPSTPA